MTTDLAKQTATPEADPFLLLENVVVAGDLTALLPAQRVDYYKAVCEHVGLNPMTMPFTYIQKDGKLTLYANKSCTEQLRKARGISVTKLEKERFDDLFVVTAYGRDREGREDSATGAVSVAGLRGEALGNAVMKAETKSKRRLTLSMGGLALLDESEIEGVPHQRIQVDPKTGEIKNGLPDFPPVPPTDQENLAKLIEEERTEWLAQIDKAKKAKSLTEAHYVLLCRKHLGAVLPEQADPAQLHDLLNAIERVTKSL